jgi:rare lipoprotein A
MMRSLAAVVSFCVLIVPANAKEDCVASVYSIGDASQPGTKTASGIPLNDNALTAAHKSLPFGTKVQVTNKKNGSSVTVTITDRGPYVRGRCIDMTKAGAQALGFAGLAPVTVSRID